MYINVNIDIRYAIKFHSCQWRRDTCRGAWFMSPCEHPEDDWHIHIFPGLNNPTRLTHQCDRNQTHHLLRHYCSVTHSSRREDKRLSVPAGFSAALIWLQVHILYAVEIFDVSGSLNAQNGQSSEEKKWREESKNVAIIVQEIIAVTFHWTYKLWFPSLCL